jgi:hypothetical protein
VRDLPLPSCCPCRYGFARNGLTTDVPMILFVWCGSPVPSAQGLLRKGTDLEEFPKPGRWFDRQNPPQAFHHPVRVSALHKMLHQNRKGCWVCVRSIAQIPHRIDFDPHASQVLENGLFCRAQLLFTQTAFRFRVGSCRFTNPLSAASWAISSTAVNFAGLSTFSRHGMNLKLMFPFANFTQQGLGELSGEADVRSKSRPFD